MACAAVADRASPQAQAAWADGRVWCGGHDAEECGDCPRGRGELWCNGDCKWDNGLCIQEGQHVGVRYKDCGAHRAVSCDECPAGWGESWCNGDCVWRDSECLDRPEGDALEELIFQLTRIKKFSNPATAKTMRKPEVQHFTVGQRVRIRDYGMTGEPMSDWKKGTVTSTKPLHVQRDGWSGSQTWDEVLPLEAERDPHKRGPPEDWEVADKRGDVSVRSGKSLSADELSVKRAGDRFPGHQEGGWVALSDEPGFIGIHLLRRISKTDQTMRVPFSANHQSKLNEPHDVALANPAGHRGIGSGQVELDIGTASRQTKDGITSPSVLELERQLGHVNGHRFILRSVLTGGVLKVESPYIKGQPVFHGAVSDPKATGHVWHLYHSLSNVVRLQNGKTGRYLHVPMTVGHPSGDNVVLGSSYGHGSRWSIIQADGSDSKSVSSDGGSDAGHGAVMLRNVHSGLYLQVASKQDTPLVQGSDISSLSGWWILDDLDTDDAENSEAAEDSAETSVAAAISAILTRKDFKAARGIILQQLRHEGDRNRLLDPLFQVWHLNAPESVAAERLIKDVWLWHPKQELRHMMQEVLQAFGNESYWSHAMFILDALVKLDPQYTEAWNKRATLHFMMGQWEESLEDISRVLLLEPRHFGALDGEKLVLQRL